MRRTLDDRANLSWQLAHMPRAFRGLSIDEYNLHWKRWRRAWLAGYNAAKAEARREGKGK